MFDKTIVNTGLGLRNEFFDELLAEKPAVVKFLEVAPENWLEVGGERGKQFTLFAEQYPITCHGLSLSLGGPTPLDLDFLQSIKTFLDQHNVVYYSEHLSYCSDDGHLYDLLPIPFTEEAVHYVAQRIRQVQDVLQRRIAIENVSYYCAPGAQLSEVEFINAVLAEADCDLLLDVNNVYVNSVNQNYNPYEFLDGLQQNTISYLHMAGHYVEEKDLLIDTHGAAICDSVWDLLQYTYQLFGAVPTLLERDFNFPNFSELTDELEKISAMQTAILNNQKVVCHV